MIKTSRGEDERKEKKRKIPRPYLNDTTTTTATTEWKQDGMFETSGVVWRETYRSLFFLLLYIYFCIFSFL